MYASLVRKGSISLTLKIPSNSGPELGGTLGDIESAPFVEAMRQLRRRAGKNNFLQIHVSLVPVIHGELKTKPTQQAIRDARSAGMSPDLVCAHDDELNVSFAKTIYRLHAVARGPSIKPP